MQNYRPNNQFQSRGPNQWNRPMTQKNLNLPYDPLMQRQNDRNFPKKKKFSHRPEIQLSIEEGAILLRVWKNNNFSDFNSWIQVAKAQMNTEIYENSNEINKYGKKIFTCNLSLTFEQDPNLVMISNGFAHNKKDARKTAIEKIIIELIQNGEISRGLKNKDFLVEGSKQTEEMFEKAAVVKYEEESNQKKIHKLAKKMQELLKKDAFLEACEVLCQILMKKKPDWNEIAFIWSYALLKKDFSYVKAIIDIIQYKRVQPSFNNHGYEETKLNEDFSISSEEEKVKRELLKKYGSCRMKGDNPYDILDTFNMEVNLPEIDSRDGRVISDEEANAEILKDPLTVDIAKLFVIDSNNALPFGNLDFRSDQLSGTQSNLSDPKATFSDPKLLNVYNAIEINKLLHQLAFQIPDITNQNQKKRSYNQDFSNTENIDSKNEQENISGWPQHLKIENFDSTGLRIDLNTSREIKDPSANYISFKLLNEFYESLLYVSDINFALSVAEVLYTRIKVDDEEFINHFACLYYSNKKNMLMIEMIESIFQPIIKSKTKLSDSITNINGQVEKIGNKHSQEVLTFTPIEAGDQLDSKILKRGGSECRENHQISEGEFVLLTCNQEPNLYPQQQINNPYMAMSFNQNFQTDLNQFNNNKNLLSQENLANGMVACVREIQKDFKIKLFVLPTKEQSELLSQKNRVWNIAKLSNRTSIDKTSEALETFATEITMAQPLLQILLSPPIGNNNYVQKLAESKVFTGQKQQETPVTNLNASQQKALTSSTFHLLTLIQGPPGTGKTTTAVEIVLEWLRVSPAPILACADSNVAVDLLYREFLQAGINAVRIGGGFEDRPDFKNDRNYSNYLSLLSSKQYHNANNIKFGIIKRLIADAHVICATCVGSTSDYLKGSTFPRVIMDEVTQANELSTLIPLIKGCQQLVLIGDHKQLPPTVISTFAQSKGMTISLFERLVKQGVQPHLLDVQYRMHPSISEFPTQKFYNNMLKNGVNALDRPIIPGFSWPNQAVRVTFVNVKGVEQIYSSSIQNTREVEVVVEILIRLLPHNHISTIGIITPYDAQRKRLRNEVNLQARKYPELFGLTQEQAQKLNKNTVLNDIDTVDGYQGMEREVIIFSAVRSNRSGSLGFLRDPRRLNVTLTRAKRGLIIVGDMETLMYDQNWKDWIQWCKKNRVILHYK